MLVFLEAQNSPPHSTLHSLFSFLFVYMSPFSQPHGKPRPCYVLLGTWHGANKLDRSLVYEIQWFPPLFCKTCSEHDTELRGKKRCAERIWCQKIELQEVLGSFQKENKCTWDLNTRPMNFSPWLHPWGPSLWGFAVLKLKETVNGGRTGILKRSSFQGLNQWKGLVFIFIKWLSWPPAHNSHISLCSFKHLPVCERAGIPRCLFNN